MAKLPRVQRRLCNYLCGLGTSPELHILQDQRSPAQLRLLELAAKHHCAPAFCSAPLYVVDCLHGCQTGVSSARVTTFTSARTPVPLPSRRYNSYLKLLLRESLAVTSWRFSCLYDIVHTMWQLCFTKCTCYRKGQE